jgi:uridine kinase
LRGDKLIIHEGHIRAGGQVAELLFPEIMEAESKFIVSIAGESGSGKSEIASVLDEWLLEREIKSIILQQDDYFIYPPKTNADMRRKDIGHVGVTEVRVELLDQNLKDMAEGKTEIEKPLVIFDEDRIERETINLEGIKVAIVEGTYTTVLRNVHRHIFIDRSYIDTRESRQQRARERQDEFLEKILEIEHEIIAAHKPRADIIVTKNYEVKMNNEKKQD